jgi:hypothetical protein
MHVLLLLIGHGAILCAVLWPISIAQICAAFTIKFYVFSAYVLKLFPSVHTYQQRERVHSDKIDKAGFQQASPRPRNPLYTPLIPLQSSETHAPSLQTLRPGRS